MITWLPIALVALGLIGCAYGVVMIRRDRAQRAAGRYFDEPVDLSVLDARWDRLTAFFRGAKS